MHTIYNITWIKNYTIPVLKITIYMYTRKYSGVLMN